MEILTPCDKEPIHLSGSIQPHGVYLGFSRIDLTLMQISGSVQEHFGQDAHSLLGKHVSQILNTETSLNLIRILVSNPAPALENPLKLELRVRDQLCKFDGIYHHLGENLLVLELESPEKADTFQKNLTLNFAQFYKNLSTNLPAMSYKNDIRELVNKTVNLVREFTGFDRVMLYQFRPDEHGTVIAEAKAEPTYSYLGQTFPDSDIPKQARTLYLSNWIRIIPDVDYTPIPIYPGTFPPSDTHLDLSFSTLRSVSPTHIQYLKNMKVAASMSISIVVENKLWGLIACHHLTPHFVSYEIRIAMESLAKHLSRMIENFETTQKLKDRSEISKSYHFYLKQLLERPDSGLAQIVAESPEKFLGMTRSQSGAITYKDQVTLIGDPKITLQQITKLREHLNRYSSTDVFVTENLSSFFSAAQEFSKSISGMISACLSRSEGVFFFWFKPEETEVIHWAGEPKKNQLPDVHSGIIHPRKSFEVWQEISRDRSSIWEEAEIVAASDFLKLFNSKSKIC